MCTGPEGRLTYKQTRRLPCVWLSLEAESWSDGPAQESYLRQQQYVRHLRVHRSGHDYMWKAAENPCRRLKERYNGAMNHVARADVFS